MEADLYHMDPCFCKPICSTVQNAFPMTAKDCKSMKFYPAAVRMYV